MINKRKYNQIIVASIIIVGSVFMSVCWKYFRDSGLMYSVPFLDISLGHNELSFVSLSPEKKKVIPFWELFPFLVQMFYVFIYFYLYKWIGAMNVYIKNKKFDLWHLQMLVLMAFFIDYMLTHRQTPCREVAILISGSIQFYYCWYMSYFVED